MRFHVMTLFPEMVKNILGESIIGRAEKAGFISTNVVNIRDYADEARKGRVDDYPFGGGAGMVMQAGPIDRCYTDITKDMAVKPRVIYVTPQGRVFDQNMARELAHEEDLVILCGHYEGVDERILEKIVTDNISIGDYVLTGGELPACVIIDAVARNVPGVLTNSDSGEEESFSDGLLEYPQYTRPAEYDGMKVPEVLLSGNHAEIAKWRHEQSVARTKERRPDLLK
ncbi:MAG: tRNA (guanosine(37)-N1)-methyltransferase TrmD [Lachnospiraceae bacterium]|nr:tRNA (guanosine(37)-N1)-methyltransferase TrmD [Candidatus Minthocola equi]